MSVVKILWIMFAVAGIAMGGPIVLITLDLVSLFRGDSITLFPEILCEEFFYEFSLNFLMVVEIISASVLYLGICSRTYICNDGGWAIYVWILTQMMLTLFGVAGIYIYQLYNGLAIIIPLLRISCSLFIFYMYRKGLVNFDPLYYGEDDDLSFKNLPLSWKIKMENPVTEEKSG